MKREGAEVVGFDLSDAQAWDVVPFARSDHARYEAERLRDPFLALQNALRLTRETVVSTEIWWRRLAAVGRLVRPSMAFRPVEDVVTADLVYRKARKQERA